MLSRAEPINSWSEDSTSQLIPTAATLDSCMAAVESAIIGRAMSTIGSDLGRFSCLSEVSEAYLRARRSLANYGRST